MKMKPLLPLLLFATMLQAQQSTPPGGAPLPWDTVSIHATDPDHLDSASGRDVPNGVSEKALPLEMLIAEAYSFAIFPMKGTIEGLPKWAKDAHYDVEARVAPEDLAAFKKLQDLPIADTVKAFAAHQYTGAMLMNQVILTERFHLKVHTEMRERNVMLLTVAKGGPHLKAAANPNDSGLSMSHGKISGTGVPAAFIANALSLPADAIVVDRTGLNGQYDFDLRFAPDAASTTDNATTNEAGLTTAVQEQLGLRLQSGKAEVPVIIVDHIDPLTDN